MSQPVKTLVQCDFDGTIIEDDVSFALLDAFAEGDWRQPLRRYQDGEITVGRFNMLAFGMVRADMKSLLQATAQNYHLRANFPEMVKYCQRRGFRFVVVSNGLDFYVQEILKRHGLKGIETFAARAVPGSNGMKVDYIGPDGNVLDNAFKETYVDWFRSQGYRIIYIGNGPSDFGPARDCDHIFATGNLVKCCKEAGIHCTPFTDFCEVIAGLEGM